MAITPTSLPESISGGQAGHLAHSATAYTAINALTAHATSLPLNVRVFGATGDGTTDDAAAIQSAIDSASTGRTVFFPPGTYKLGSLVTLSSNVKMQGAPGAVIDFSTVAATGSAKIAMRAQGSVGSTLALSVNGAKGAYSVTLASVSGLAVGDWVRLSSDADYPYDTGFKRGEIKQIRLIAGSVVTFEQALYDDYPTASTSVVRKITTVDNIEVSGLTFRGSDTPASAERALALEFVNGFSVHHNQFEKIDQYCVYVRSSIRGDVSLNMFRGVYYDGVTGTIFYGIFLSSAAQWVRVHGNHGERVRHLITLSAATNDPGAPRHITCTGNVAQNLMAGAAGRSWAFEHHGIGENILFSGNVADGCYGGFVTRGPGVSFIGNTVRNWYAYALHIHPDTEDARDIIISGNTVQDRTVEGGGFATPAAVRGELTNATVVSNVVVSGNHLNFDVTGRAAVDIDGATVTAASLIVRDNNIAHPSASVDSISLTVKGGARHANTINGVRESDDSTEFRSSMVSTMPRQFIAASVGTITSGWEIAARARCQLAGTYTKVRFITGTTAPVLTDFRAGVWDSAGAVLAETANASATVTAASTLYELTFSSPITLAAGQEVFLGFAVLGGTPGTYRGYAGVVDYVDLSPAIARRRSGWAGGALSALNTSASTVPWVELVP